MSSASIRHRRRRVSPGITLTPMLDVIFNLIFFFILATTIRDETFMMDITLPQSQTASQPVPEDFPPTITLDAEGRIQFKGRLMVRDELELELFHLAGKGRQEVLISGDESVAWGRIFEVIDLCESAGLVAVQVHARSLARTATPSNRAE